MFYSTVFYLEQKLNKSGGQILKARFQPFVNKRWPPWLEPFLAKFKVFLRKLGTLKRCKKVFTHTIISSRTRLKHPYFTFFFENMNLKISAYDVEWNHFTSFWTLKRANGISGILAHGNREFPKLKNFSSKAEYHRLGGFNVAKNIERIESSLPLNYWKAWKRKKKRKLSKSGVFKSFDWCSYLQRKTIYLISRKVSQTFVPAA